MRQDSRCRSDARSDYMQFSQFLENAKAAREGNGSCCDVRRAEAPIEPQHPVGMVYGVSQKWTEIYETEVGFHYGTIFKELNLPLYRTGCTDRGGCRG